MFFFMKSSVLHVDCFTDRLDVYEYFPITKSSEYLPEWWKRLPKEKKQTKKSFYDIPHPMSTIKTCFGFTEFYSRGFTIPLWTDLFIKFSEDDKNYFWQFSDRISEASGHDLTIQATGFVNPSEWTNFKLVSPWHIKTKGNFCLIGNIWNMKNLDEILVAPGILNFEHQHTTNINFFLKVIPNREILLEANSSLVNIIPMTDKKIKIHNHLISTEEFRNFEKNNFFINKFQKLRRIGGNKKKCPFAY